MLEMRDLRLAFGPHTVLDGIGLDVRPGERIGVIGPSGAGKSTLLRLAAGLLRPDEGTCHNTFQRTRLVFQEPRLLPWRSVADNLDIALRAGGVPAVLGGGAGSLGGPAGGGVSVGVGPYRFL